jgi:pilus assembly protein Flp/PilA
MEAFEMRTIVDRVKWLYADEEGATMVEYALLLALIAVVCILAVTNLGTAVKTKMNSSTTALGGTAAP